MKIAFLDYWQTLDPHRGGKNWIWEQVKDVAELAHPWTADLIIHSNYGSAWRQYTDKPRIFHTAEPWNKTEADAERGAIHTFGFETDGDRQTRLPNWLFYLDPARDYNAPGTVTPAQLAGRRERILAIVTNPFCPERNAIMAAALDAGLMDSMGGHMANKPRVRSKYAACGMYKFVLAYENCIQPGYTTEKIIDAINADAIPIHWGAEQTDFNPARIISRADFGSDAALLDHVRELTRHPDELAEIINRPAILQEQDIRPHVRQRVREVILGMAG